MASGTAAIRKRTPSRAARRLVRNSCDNSDSAWTVKSSAAKTRMRCAVSVKAPATSRACSM